MTAPITMWLLGADRQWHALGGRVIGPPPPPAVLRVLSTRATQFGTVPTDPPVDPPTGQLTAAQWLTAFQANSAGMKPSGANTGVPAGTSLTTLVPSSLGAYNSSTGVITVSDSNVTIDKYYIPYHLKITGNNVVFRNSEIVGSTIAPGSESALIDHRQASQVGLRVEYCTLHPQTPNYYLNAFIGHHATILSCEIYHVVDALGIYNNNTGTQPLTGAPYKDDGDVKMYGNWAHDFAFFYPDPAHSDGTHNDFVQFHGGRRSEILGNTVQWFAAPASQFNASTQALAVQGANAFVAQQGGVDATATANRGYGSGFFINKIVSDITLNKVKWNWMSGTAGQIVPRVCYGNDFGENRLDFTGKAYTSGFHGPGPGSASIYVIRTDTSTINSNTGVFTNVIDATGTPVALDPANPANGRYGVRVDS